MTEGRANDGNGLCQGCGQWSGAGAAAGRRRGIVWGATPWGKDSFELEAVLEDGRLLAAYLNESVGRTVAGGRLLVADMRNRQAIITDVAAI